MGREGNNVEVIANSPRARVCSILFTVRSPVPSTMAGT